MRILYKVVFLGGVAVFSLGVIFITQYIRFNDSKLHVVFCDVGQGDAIFIKTAQNKTILLDGGPNEKVLGCLSNHLPFWHHTLDIMLLSHPHEDHIYGLIPVLERYTVKHFGTEDVANNTGSFLQLQRLLKEKKIETRFFLAGDSIKTQDSELLFVGPSKTFLKQTSPNGIIGEQKEFASLIFLLRYKNFTILFTGDSQAMGIEEALAKGGNSLQADVLQVPHHGSKTGLTKAVVEEIAPAFAVISVGKGNRYNHPSKETLDLLEKYTIPVARTDTNGEIEIITDGNWWEINSKLKVKN